MQAVVRETSYSIDKPIYETEEFQEFQKEHRNLSGFKGTVVVDAGNNRFLTLTLWETAEDKADARETIGPVVERTLKPLVATRPKLLGSGNVVINNIQSESS